MKVGQLSAGDCQMVEIARALVFNPKIIIFDEPTSSLSNPEKERLFGTIELLKEDQVAVIYITHFLDEIYEVCERALILRNGKVSGEGMLAQMTRLQVVQKMIGEQDVDLHSKDTSKKKTNVLLEVKDMCVGNKLHSVNFELHEGEILGIWGLLGSGRTELVKALIGLDEVVNGQVFITQNGERKQIEPNKLKKLTGYVTENRREEGLFLTQTVKFNMSLANIGKYLDRVTFIEQKKEVEKRWNMSTICGSSYPGLDKRLPL
jgi:ABC-type sugar transport system ATPase subunit